MLDKLNRANETRLRLINDTPQEIREKYSQYLTPPETAKMAASMFSRDVQDAKCLDLGAGTGILTVALYERFKSKINQMDAIEIDPNLSTILRNTLSSLDVAYDLMIGDALINTPKRKYDYIILNPPYKKMRANDRRQKLLPCKVANLYAAFMIIGLLHLKDHGEMVAIVPRSWMNGSYFAEFRKYVFKNYSLDSMHIYESRTEIFSDTNVLQETMIVKFSKQHQSKNIIVSYSKNKSDKVEQKLYKTNKLIDSQDYTVRINPQSQKLPLSTISSMGLCPSTGKIVDFRNKEYLFKEKPKYPEIYPAYYAGNFSNSGIVHPQDLGKPQWFLAKETKQIKMLTQPGAYTIIKRFTSKEEKKRILAYPLIIKNPVALENHLNFIHEGTSHNVIPLRSQNLAKGLAVWCNSSMIDEWFRDISGSTQVNASDIKRIPCPTIKKLEQMGKLWEWNLTQAEIDKICKEKQ